MISKYWRIWSLSLGEKAHPNKCDADKVAIIRTIFAVINLGTCVLISTNILKGWGVL